VLDYFDAFLIGLTATPDKRTFGFFNENIVAEYTYEQSVADGVNVGYDVYEIETEITQERRRAQGQGEWVDHRDRQPAKSAGARPKKTPPTPAKSWTAPWSTPEPDPHRSSRP
jgi:type I restriction enzyme R subunit